MFLKEVRLTLFHSCVMHAAPAERKARVFEKGKLVVGGWEGGGKGEDLGEKRRRGRRGREGGFRMLR